MKKLCRKNMYSFFDNSEWQKIENGRLRYIDIGDLGLPKESQLIVFNDFETAHDYLSKNLMCSAYNSRTFPLNKPCIRYRIDYGDYKTIKKSSFKSFGEKTVWEETQYNNYTFNELSKILLADEFIEYCKDHGMTVCPLQ